MKRINPAYVYAQKEPWMLFRRWMQKHNLCFHAPGTPETAKQVEDFCKAYNEYYKKHPRRGPLLTRDGFHRNYGFNNALQ